MKTFKLWFVPDKTIPRLLQLCWEQVEVPIEDVLLRGIHPIWRNNDYESLQQKFVEVLNEAGVKLPHLAQLGYCHDASSEIHHYSNSNSHVFEELLKRISRSILFVKEMTYIELLNLAKMNLARQWGHKLAFTLLSNACHDFDAMRSFVKARDKSVKISAYVDFDDFNLGEILSLEDFAEEEQILIREGLPATNFRSAAFLTKITDDEGRLHLTESIKHFKVTLDDSPNRFPDPLSYNCQRDGRQIRFQPELGKNSAKRKVARAIAEKWRTDQGKYCFTADIERLTQMLQQPRSNITFPSLDYMRTRNPGASSVMPTSSKIECFTIGTYLMYHHSGNAMREVLRSHGVSMTGRKEQLVEKLAQLAAKVYTGRNAELDAYFKQYRFIRVKTAGKQSTVSFPVLQELDIRSMILAMYTLKHLRGNTVLEAAHSNNSFDLISLARSLIKQEVSVSGVFLQVQ
jgi:hypothetical protein